MVETRTLPRYSIIGPPLIGDYGIVDEWKTQSYITTVLEPRYADRRKAEKDCAVLNRAQAILSGQRKP